MLSDNVAYIIQATVHTVMCTPLHGIQPSPKATFNGQNVVAVNTVGEEQVFSAMGERQ